MRRLLGYLSRGSCSTIFMSVVSESGLQNYSILNYRTKFNHKKIKQNEILWKFSCFLPFFRAKLHAAPQYASFEK